MEVPILPINGTSIQFERHALRLSDINWFELVSETDVLLNRFSIEVSCGRFVEWSTFLWDIDVDDLLGFDVINRAKIQREGVLQVINVWSVIHESLLESRAVGESFVVSTTNVSHCSN